MRSLLAAGLFLVAACAQPLQGVDLPLASLPEDIDSAQWAMPFFHEFGPGFWPQGPHVYQLLFDCPGVGEEDVKSELIFFAAGSDFPTIDDEVHLRLQGISTTTMGPPDLQFVSTDQETTALLTVVGLSDAQVEAAAECAGEIQWDDGQSAPLQPGEPFRP